MIGASNPGTRDIPPTLEAQVANLFTHLRAATSRPRAARPTTSSRSTSGRRTRRAARALNDEWVKMFPDPDARPARHTQALPADSRALIQADFTAVLS